MLIDFNKISTDRVRYHTFPMQNIKHICLQIMQLSITESLDASKRQTTLCLFYSWGYDICHYLISGPTTKRPVRPMSAPLPGTRTRSQSSPDVWDDVSICLINNRNVKDKKSYEVV